MPFKCSPLHFPLFFTKIEIQIVGLMIAQKTVFCNIYLKRSKRLDSGEDCRHFPNHLTYGKEVTKNINWPSGMLLSKKASIPNQNAERLCASSLYIVMIYSLKELITLSGALIACHQALFGTNDNNMYYDVCITMKIPTQNIIRNE